MNELSKLPERDSRQRDERDGEYTIPAVGGVGRVVCYRKGLQLIDFYRQSSVLSKDVPGRARMNSEVAGKSERDKQMEEIPPVKVNPPISKPVEVKL